MPWPRSGAESTAHAGRDIVCDIHLVFLPVRLIEHLDLDVDIGEVEDQLLLGPLILTLGTHVEFLYQRVLQFEQHVFLAGVSGTQKRNLTFFALEIDRGGLKERARAGVDILADNDRVYSRLRGFTIESAPDLIRCKFSVQAPLKGSQVHPPILAFKALLGGIALDWVAVVEPHVDAHETLLP